MNYYTGQFLDIASMSPILKSQEITFGLDLAHAVGNVPLELHDWELILLHGALTSTSTLDRAALP